LSTALENAVKNNEKQLLFNFITSRQSNFGRIGGRWRTAGTSYLSEVYISKCQEPLADIEYHSIRLYTLKRRLYGRYCLLDCVIETCIYSDHEPFRQTVCKPTASVHGGCLVRAVDRMALIIATALVISVVCTCNGICILRPLAKITIQ